MGISKTFVRAIKFPPVLFTISILIAYLPVGAIGYLYPSLLTPSPFMLITGQEAPAEGGEKGSLDLTVTMIIKEAHEPLSYGFNGTHGGPTVKVKKGELIRITIVNEGRKVHNIVIPDLDVNMGYTQPDKSRSTDFRPDVSGRFSYFCAVDDHRWLGMEGVLTVEE